MSPHRSPAVHGLVHLETMQADRWYLRLKCGVILDLAKTVNRQLKAGWQKALGLIRV